MAPGAGADQRRGAVVPRAPLGGSPLPDWAMRGQRDHESPGSTLAGCVLRRVLPRRPVNATFTGVHAYDDRLPDLSGGGCAGQARKARPAADVCTSLPAEPLSSAESLNRGARQGFSPDPTVGGGRFAAGPTKPIHLRGRPSSGWSACCCIHPRPASPARSNDSKIFLISCRPAWTRSAARRGVDPAGAPRVRGAGLLLADIASAYPELRTAVPRRDAFARFDDVLQHKVDAKPGVRVRWRCLELLLRHAPHGHDRRRRCGALALDRIAQEDDALRAASPGLMRRNDATTSRFDALWRTARDLASATTC